jgi:6-phosphogluconolactonase
MSREIIVCNDLEDLSLKAAAIFQRLSEDSIRADGRFTVALSGGHTPKSLFTLLASDPYRTGIQWERVHFFWGDERCVPPDDEQSNFRMTKESLLQHISIPQQNIHRILAEMPDHNAAAEKYENHIRQFFSAESGIPRFHLILLGMGPDGHTASLFPETAALQNAKDLVTANYVEKFGTFRITFTYPLINNAANVVFLISGKDKAAALKEVLEGKYQPELFPSQNINPTNGTLRFLVDRDAASLLKGS